MTALIYYYFDMAERPAMPRRKENIDARHHKTTFGIYSETYADDFSLFSKRENKEIYFVDARIF